MALNFPKAGAAWWLSAQFSHLCIGCASNSGRMPGGPTAATRLRRHGGRLQGLGGGPGRLSTLTAIYLEALMRSGLCPQVMARNP